MSIARAAAGSPLGVAGGTSPYVPGVCNIGPAEIGRRRRFGHLALAITVLIYVGFVAFHVPPLARFLLALPAAGAATGYLQAALHFCAGFGSRGLFNFGELGAEVQVTDPEALARDRARSRQIALLSLAVGLAVGLVAVLLPL